MTYGNNDFTDREQQRSEQLRADIEKTRARMAGDVEAIGNKLSPDNLKHEAKTALKRGFDERTAGIRTRVRHAGSSVRRNPVPYALIGLGVGWLFFDARRRSHGYDMDAELPIDDDYMQALENEPIGESEPSLRERAGELTSRASARAGAMGQNAKQRAMQMRHRAREGAVVVRDRAGHFMDENPLVVGAVAVAAGIGVGLLLPSTGREDRWFGERRDRLVGMAKEKAHQAGEIATETAKRTAQVAADAAKQSVKEGAQQRGMMGGSGSAQGQSGGEYQPQSGQSGEQGMEESVTVTEVRSVGTEGWQSGQNGRRSS